MDAGSRQDLERVITALEKFAAGQGNDDFPFDCPKYAMHYAAFELRLLIRAVEESEAPQSALSTEQLEEE